MEKQNLVRNNGVIRLPPGFRFQPTDEELVAQYLMRKVLSIPVPASIIPEFDVCKSNPWDLPGDREQERYFFSTKEVKYPNNGSRSNRATGSGYWKATGPEKQIVSYNKQRNVNVMVVGMKRTLVFYMGKPGKGSRTDWVMHEYRLATSPQTTTTDNVAQESWVLCRIFLKTRNKIKHNNKRGRDDVSCDFMGKKDDSNRVLENPSPSDASSGITTTDDYHELSSSANSYHHHF